MRLIVLAVGARAGELDARLLAPALDRIVDEDGIVVRVEAQKREGQPFAHHAHDLAEEHLLAVKQRRALGPAGRDVGEHQRLHEAAAGHRAAMRNQVGLHEPRSRIAPVSIGPDRDRAPDRRRARHTPASVAALARRSQHPIDGGRADRLETHPDLGVERQMPVPLHRRHQRRDERLQSLAADPVRCFPQNDQCLAHCVVVNAPFGSRLRAVRPRRRTQHPRGMRAMVARHRGELAQDAPLLRSACLSIARRQRLQQLVSRRHAHPPQRRLPNRSVRQQS